MRHGDVQRGCVRYNTVKLTLCASSFMMRLCIVKTLQSVILPLEVGRISLVHRGCHRDAAVGTK